MYIQVHCEELEMQCLCVFFAFPPPRQTKFTHEHWEPWRFGSPPLAGQPQVSATGAKSGALVCTPESFILFLSVRAQATHPNNHLNPIFPKLAISPYNHHAAFNACIRSFEKLTIRGSLALKGSGGFPSKDADNFQKFPLLKLLFLTATQCHTIPEACRLCVRNDSSRFLNSKIKTTDREFGKAEPALVDIRSRESVTNKIIFTNTQI